MKKYFLAALIAALAAGTSFAGIVDISGRAGIYTAPGANASSAMYGLAANVRLTDNWQVRASIDTTSYTVNNNSVTYVPVRLDVIYTQTVAAFFHPYAGVGASYNTLTVTGSPSTTSTGAQAEAGISFNLGGFAAGVEYCYLIPDLNHTGTGASSVSAYMTGGFTQSFGF